MKRSSVPILLIGLMLAASLNIRTAPAAPPPAAALETEVAGALQALLDDQVQTQGVLGMIMAVRLPDGTIVTRSSGYTDPAGEHVWTPETVSPLGSVTKTFTAVVVMQLVEQGRLSLDDTIDAWFPDQPNAGRITVRMLLSHTSGLANAILPGNQTDPKWAEEWAPLDFIAEANGNGPLAEPGSGIAHYSNAGYFLLGLIIEAVTGNSWKQEVRSRIIEPLGMTQTIFLDDEGVRDIIVKGYLKMPQGYVSSLDTIRLHPTTAWAAGGVVSPIADLMTFAGALFDGALVSRETLTEMATPLAKDAETGRLWGLGGATLESVPGGFGMGGDVPGYHAFFVGLQDSKVVVGALVNTEEGDVVGPGLMAFEYLRSLLPAR